jgi:osomolarity two-component system, sensor histidine kinase NIK1
LAALQSAIMGDSTLSAASSLLQSLATNTHITPTSYQSHQVVKLPGADTPAKLALERDIAALVARVQSLETKAITVNNQTLPDTPNETGAPSAFADVLTGGPGRASTKNSPARKSSNNSLLAGRESATGERPQKLPRLSNDELIETLQQQIDDQAKQIQNGKLKQDAIQAQMLEQAQQQEKAINQYEVERVASLERELKKHQQANEAFQKALREIGEIITAVARGDLSKKVQIHSVEMDPEITTFKRVSHVSPYPLFLSLTCL